MDRFARLTGRQYHLFDYDGPADAERVIVLMGSGAETARETAAALRARGEKVGVLQVRLYRPFSPRDLFSPRCRRRVAPSRCSSRPRSPARRASRCISTSSTTLAQAVSRGKRAAMPLVIGGRYGLSSKDFTPAHGQGGVRRTGEAGAEEQLHRRHQRRCLAHQPGGRSELFRSNRTTSCARCSTAWAPTARWAPTRTA